MHKRNGAEEARLAAAREQNVPWRKWGPYLSERQWGTVREDYSQTGNASDYLTHGQAHSRASIAGVRTAWRHLRRSAVSPLRAGAVEREGFILKERPFGLTNSEGNHGGDAKEYYFYLDGTPTHSYIEVSVQASEDVYLLR